jgi:4-oxalocrotonate tautomerase
LLARGGDTGFQFRKPFREPAQAFANFDQAEINSLQVNQVFEVGMHLHDILAQAPGWAGIAFRPVLRFFRRGSSRSTVDDSWRSSRVARTPIFRNLLEDKEMPDVHITWLEGRTADQKRKVAQRITQVLMEEAGAKSESTHVVFVDVPTTNFASGGVTVADRKPKS